ncbi:S1/P1 nuclease [Zunongwangia sp. F363]|uniref:S1/P1 nuclease n=1 Tax=Autumnicola tepida TaxID=3075595 RepID=A0ABU3C9U2_9FLAO|nr:S1/P1 nuclease [Zunongwangia sp. F363]MDT0642972.1 S1/P1 nuclease [Zunongwangia sp. F363]
MKQSLILLFSVLIMNTTLANNEDWGKTGHRATAEIAESYLTKKAKRNIEELLNGRSLAFVANYADDIKSDPEFRKYGPWHYVNIDLEDEKYMPEKANPKGDLVQAIRKCISVLKDNSAPKEEKQFYLKMLVHFMGDLHQPFHAGRSADKGGNDIQVRWFGEGSNIHRVWDSDMIDSFQMSYTELAENTKDLSKEEMEKIKSGSLLDWVYESRDLADTLYASVDNGEKLGYEYMYERFPMVLEQLQKGGLRLAKVLNDIYG